MNDMYRRLIRIEAAQHIRRRPLSRWDWWAMTETECDDLEGPRERVDRFGMETLTDEEVDRAASLAERYMVQR